MALLTCQKLTHTFLDQPIFSDVSFHLEAKEKAALQGVNGSGKTTLLRIISGTLAPTSGQVLIARDARVGYLAQIAPVNGSTGIYDALAEAKAEIFAMERALRGMEKEMKSATGEALQALMQTYAEQTHAFELANGFAARSEIEGVFRGLGFEEADRDRPVESLSGGQKTRLALGQLLLSSPDLLLLDEPTNHLDLDSIRWLESYLASFGGAVLLVSHDRWFLDRIVSKVFDLDHGRVTTYPGSYTTYCEKKSARRKAELHAWKKQEEEIRHQEAVIQKLRQFNREKSIRRAESREKALAKMELTDRPSAEASGMQLDLAPRIESGTDVLTVDSLSKSFDALHLITDQSFLIRRGERVAVIGKNGCGKTTLLRMIQRELLPDAGEIRRGTGVEIGYFDQSHGALDPEKTIFDEIHDTWPELNHTKIRNVLAAFLFRGDDVFQKIGTLSGGEQGRVMLAKLMLSQANFLLLDEPTNHLDALSKEVLEDALRAYTGTVLYVSHDRYFIDRTATRILELSDGVLTEYLGNYQDYLDRSGVGSAPQSTGGNRPAPLRADAPSGHADQDADGSGSKQDWQAQKQRDAAARKKARAIRDVEEEIAAIEARQKELDHTLSLPETGLDADLCRSLANEQAQLLLRLETCYETWESLMEDE